MGTTTSPDNLYRPAIGETGWGTLVNQNFATIQQRLTDMAINPMSLEYGAQFDGTTDDTAAITAAITDAKVDNIPVLFPGLAKVTSTISLTDCQVSLLGTGVRSGLLWAGDNTTPVIAVSGWYGSRIANMRIMGQPGIAGNKATAAIAFHSSSGHNCYADVIENVWIGPQTGDTLDTTFTNGIWMDAASGAVNNDSIAIRDCRINYCTTGLNIDGTQFVDNAINNLRILNCGTGLNLVASNTSIGTLQFAGSTTTDIAVSGGALATIALATSEGATRYAVVTGTSSLEICGGYFQAGSSITAGGDFISAVDDAAPQSVTLRNWRLTVASGYAGPTPIIAVHGGGGTANKALILDRVKGSSGAGAFSETTLSCSPANANPANELIVVEGTIYAAGWKTFRNELSGSTTILPNFSVFIPGPVRQFALTDGASVPVNLTKGSYFTLAAGGSRTIAAPTNPTAGRSYTFEILNNTGGAITTTWNAAYVLAGGAWTDPATTKRRIITFYYNGTSLLETSRTSGDL